MSRILRVSALLSVAGLVLGAVILAGCNSPASKSESKGTPIAQTPAKPAEAPAQAAARQPESAARPKADPEGLKELSAADRALAEKQAICPVTGEPLGSMGTPYKVTVKGRTVFLCCDGCEAKIKKDPDKYLAKLDAAK